MISRWIGRLAGMSGPTKMSILNAMSKPSASIHRRLPADVLQHHPSRYVGSRIAIDATRKHKYPAISLPPKEHLDLVASRWKEYGIED